MLVTFSSGPAVLFCYVRYFIFYFFSDQFFVMLVMFSSGVHKITTTGQPKGDKYPTSHF